MALLSATSGAPASTTSSCSSGGPLSPSESVALTDAVNAVEPWAKRQLKLPAVSVCRSDAATLTP